MSAPPVARVPWARLEPSQQPLKQSRFFKEVLNAPEDATQAESNVRMYRLMTDSFFPYYLAARYHSMDTVALSSKAKQPGNYWAHATHFLLTNQLHGVTFWQLAGGCCLKPENVDIIDTLPFLKDRKKSEMFKGGLELCTTGAEFLLDPWVILQLPWHPVLLLQWTAGVLIEIYALRLELVELYRWPLPSKMTPAVVKLFKLVFDLPSFVIQCCLQLLARHYNLTSKITVYNDVKTFTTLVAQNLVPMIEFMTSGKAREVARALRRMSTGASFKFDTRTGETDHVPYHYMDWEAGYNCVFSDNFWKLGKPEQMIGMSLDELYDDTEMDRAYKLGILHGSSEFFEEETEQWLKDMRTKYGTTIDPSKIMSLLEHKIDKGVISGATKEELLQGIKMHQPYFTKCFYRIMEMRANIEGGLRVEDAGVIYNVLVQRTKFRIADVEGAMLAKLFEYCLSEIGTDVRLHAVDAQGPLLTFKEINKILLQAKETKKRTKLQWKDIKLKIPPTARARVSKYETCPSLSGGPQSVAENFELRIKRIVFNMLTDHEKLGTPNSSKFNPDCQFVQYILPCFVASFLDFAAFPEVKQEHKENYIRIIHELIKGFEVDPFKVTTMQGPFPGGYSPYLLSSLGLTYARLWQEELLHNSLVKALGDSPHSKKIVEQFDKNFVSVLLDYQDTSTKSAARVEYFKFIHMMWGVQVYRLFNRILKAIEKATPKYLKNFNALEKYLTANIALMDFKYRFLNQDPKVSITSDMSLLEENAIFELMCFNVMTQAKKLLGVTRPLLEFAEVRFGLEMTIFAEGRTLTIDQVAGVLIFYCLQTMAGTGVFEHEGELRVPVDRTEEIFFAWRTNDRVKLKLLLAQMFTLDGTDQSVVTYEFAKTKAPWNYRDVLWQVVNGRVEMKPGELTLLPLRHCRWCGLVNSAKLRMCSECADEMHHPDKTWFCGDECEQKALDAVHMEEHIRRLIIGVGIEKPRLELEQESEKGPAQRGGVGMKKKKKSGRAKK